MIQMMMPMQRLRSLFSRRRGTLLIVSCLLLSACATDPVGTAPPQTVPRLHLPLFTPEVSATRAKTLGANAFAAGDYPVAVRYFQSAADQDPQDADAWLALGGAADRAGHFDISATAYARLRDLAGASAEYHNNRGFSFLLQNRLQDARAAFRAGLQRAPGNETLQNNLRLVDKLEGRGPVGRFQ